MHEGVGHQAYEGCNEAGTDGKGHPHSYQVKRDPPLTTVVHVGKGMNMDIPEEEQPESRDGKGAEGPGPDPAHGHSRQGDMDQVDRREWVGRTATAVKQAGEKQDVQAQHQSGQGRSYWLRPS